MSGLVLDCATFSAGAEISFSNLLKCLSDSLKLNMYFLFVFMTVHTVVLRMLLRPCLCMSKTTTTTSLPSQEQCGWRQRSLKQHSLPAPLLSANQWVLLLNKSLSLHQLWHQLHQLKTLSLVEETISHIKWITTNPKTGSHTLVSMSIDAKSIGALNVPREDDGVIILLRDMTSGLSCSLSAKRSRNRNLLRINRSKLRRLQPTTIKDLPIRVSQHLVLCTMVQPMSHCRLCPRCFIALMSCSMTAVTMNLLEVLAGYFLCVCGHYSSS